MRLPGSVIVSLPNCSVPKHREPPAPAPAGTPGPCSTYRRPIMGAERELESGTCTATSRDSPSPPAFAASLYRGGESCQWGGALETTSCWKILSVPALKDSLSQGPHCQQGLTLGSSPCPELVFRQMCWFWCWEKQERGPPNTSVPRVCFFLG